MAEVSYPWNPGDPGGAADLGSWVNIFRALGLGGVFIGEGAECVLSAPGGFQINVGTGKAIGAGHYYENNATKTIALVANATGATRFDRAVIRFDMQNRTAQAIVVVGDNANPPALAQDLTDQYDLNLGVILVGLGTPSIGSGNIIPALDRWASPINEVGRVGHLEDYTGRIANLSKLYAPCYGQGPITRWAYEKLWNAWPTMGGFGVPPFHGRHFDGSNRLIFPDLRSRATFGTGDMGTGSQADIMKAGGTPSLGMLLGSSQFTVDDMPIHGHDFPHRSDAAPHLLWQVLSATTYLCTAATPGHDTQPVTGSNADSIWHTEDGMHTGVTEPRGQADPFDPDDNRVPPAFLCYKAVRVC